MTSEKHLFAYVYVISKRWVTDTRQIPLLLFVQGFLNLWSESHLTFIFSLVMSPSNLYAILEANLHSYSQWDGLIQEQIKRDEEESGSWVQIFWQYVGNDMISEWKYEDILVGHQHF